MLPIVNTEPRKIEEYEGLAPAGLLREIQELAGGLRGLKVFHVNSSPRGGGVAEILKGLVPFMKGAGLDAEWYTIPPQSSFFEITKKIHNALQGEEYKFPFAARKKYLQHMGSIAGLMRDMEPDIWVIHDPQPAGVILFLPRFHPSVSRLHIDLTSPNPDVWRFVSSFIRNYDKVVVSSPDFVKSEVRDKAEVFAPAIDVLSPKNREVSPEDASRILENFGIDLDRPLVAQVSRFDPWKDPLGVIEAYELAKKKIPGLQLALVGFMLAQDDPEAEEIAKKAKKKAEKDKDIFLFSDVDQLGSLAIDSFVGSVQSAADIILQKSLREGFGMTVAEAMWKEKPVIGGAAGGIKLQIKDGGNGFLVSSPEEAALKIVELIQNPGLGLRMGMEAKKTVRENFLMPRLLRDYLRLFKGIARP